MNLPSRRALAASLVIVLSFIAACSGGAAEPLPVRTTDRLVLAATEPQLELLQRIVAELDEAGGNEVRQLAVRALKSSSTTIIRAIQPPPLPAQGRRLRRTAPEDFSPVGPA